MKSQQRNLARWTTMCALAAVSCGDAGPRSHTTPWDGNRTQIIDADGTVREVSTPTGEGCLDVSTSCVQPQKTCEGRAADLVFGPAGELIETVCYPAAGTLSVEEIAARDGNVAQNENNSVIVLDDLDDGIDIDGDLAVDANNVVIYGENPDNSLIAGDLSVDGNNAIVRGVRIQGDVTILKNNATLLHCVIEGNLTIQGNNAVVAGCDVLGSVTVQGNNTKLAGNHIAGKLSAVGKNAECTSNFAADDANENGVLEPAELGSALSCGG